MYVHTCICVTVKITMFDAFLDCASYLTLNTSPVTSGEKLSHKQLYPVAIFCKLETTMIN